MVEEVFEGIREYITRGQNMVAQYVATRPLMDLCERSSRRPWSRVSRRWSEQAGIDLEGAKKRAVVAGESNGEEKIGKEERMLLE